jgi:hypothetical protein
VFVTGVTIGAGTKPLHDLITSIQHQNTPKTGCIELPGLA